MNSTNQAFHMPNQDESTVSRFINEIIPTYKTQDNIPNIKIASSNDAAELLDKLFPVQLDHREAMVALFLNRSNFTIGYLVISIGGISGTVCDPKLLFQTALVCSATGLIIAHNHPSGKLQPSDSDNQLTSKVVAAGKFLDIQILDHIILTKTTYFSFADEGLLN
jgi:DNA repair protein RadC